METLDSILMLIRPSSSNHRNSHNNVILRYLQEKSGEKQKLNGPLLHWYMKDIVCIYILNAQVVWSHPRASSNYLNLSILVQCEQSKTSYWPRSSIISKEGSSKCLMNNRGQITWRNSWGSLGSIPLSFWALLFYLMTCAHWIYIAFVGYVQVGDFFFLQAFLGYVSEYVKRINIDLTIHISSFRWYKLIDHK